MGCGPQKNVRIDARSNARKPENVLEKMSEVIWEQQRGKNVRRYLETEEGKNMEKWWNLETVVRKKTKLKEIISCMAQTNPGKN